MTAVLSERTTLRLEQCAGPLILYLPLVRKPQLQSTILPVVRPSQVLVVETAFDMHESSVTAFCRHHLEPCVFTRNIVFGKLDKANKIVDTLMYVAQVFFVVV